MVSKFFSSQSASLRRHQHLSNALLVWLLTCSYPIFATSITLDENEEYGETRSGLIPYAFSTEALGTAIGVGAFISGVRQAQSSLTMTGYTSNNDSWLFAGSLAKFRFSDYDRWYFNIFILGAHFTDQRFYASPAREFGNQAGSNDSSPDDFITGISNDANLEFGFNHPFAIGWGEKNPLTVFKTRKGLLVSEAQGGSHWNPMTSGLTTLGGRYFFRNRDLKEIPEDNLLASNTNGMMLWLDYNNTDFPSNPSYGSRQKFTISKDFGLANSSNSWSNLTLDVSKYYDLGTSRWFRQQVLALNLWTSSTPSWDRDTGTDINHRAPPGYGAELGGFDRLRAYPSNRFRDKSAVYYGAEVRLIPEINGLNTLPLLKHLEIDWWQIVGFTEAGRVAAKYDSDLFVEDLKWDVGLSFRIMAFRMPLRLDWAISEEGPSVWAMYEQTFTR